MSNDTQAERQRKKGIYLLPNLFTTGTIFGGFYAIIAATQGRFEDAAIAIFIAMVMDALDGRVARLTNTQSDFGMQYDSLADMVSFGVAPALIMYEWQLKGLIDWPPLFGEPGLWAKIGWAAAFIYVSAAALRLARFNVQSGKAEDKRYFIGVPSPSAAALVVGTVWVLHRGQYEEIASWIPYLCIALTAGAGFLMVSNIVYYSFKDVDTIKKVPFFVMPAIALVVTVVSFNPSVFIYITFLTYIASGPIMWVAKKLMLKRQRSKRATTSTNK
jgi:CDP-diacylglycerol--serine O-phosphatidyltransferase